MSVEHDDERGPTKNPTPGAEASGRSERPSRPPHERLPFERIMPDLLKRSLEVGRGSVPRDIAGYLVGQLSDAREGVVTAVAQEVGRFLRQADIASELRNVLAGLEVEASVRFRFRRVPAEDAAPEEKPEEPPQRPSTAPHPRT